MQPRMVGSIVSPAGLKAVDWMQRHCGVRASQQAYRHRLPRSRYFRLNSLWSLRRVRRALCIQQ
ncbi:hypothetical protein EON67_06820 [archaeon]|nr:MAG: hypothetical protein EON67_06820 [archaeon]